MRRTFLIECIHSNYIPDNKFSGAMHYLKRDTETSFILSMTFLPSIYFENFAYNNFLVPNVIHEIMKTQQI